MSKRSVPPLRWRFASSRILRVDFDVDAVLVSATKDTEIWSLHSYGKESGGTVELTRAMGGFWFAFINSPHFVRTAFSKARFSELIEALRWVRSNIAE